MIVTCENCDTKFNFDENLIKESGSKVRCSRCRHIFTVYKPAPAEEEIELEELVLEEEPAPVEEEIALEEAVEPLEEAPEEAPEIDITEAEEKPAEEEIELEELGLEEEPAPEEPTPVEEEIALEEAVEAEAMEEAGEELPEAISEEPVEEAGEEVEEEPMPPPVVEEEPPARRPISTPVMIGLALVLLAGGAFGAYALLRSFDVKIPFLESLTGAPEPAAVEPGNLRITLVEHLIKGEFVENSATGSLFVIQGMVRNDYPEARNFIMVKGVLYSKDGKAIQKRTTYCGNVLSDSDLQALDKATIDKRLRNKFGDERSNFRIPSGKVLPFVVVFSDLPQELGEFSVEVVSSAPGQ